MTKLIEITRNSSACRHHGVLCHWHTGKGDRPCVHPDKHPNAGFHCPTYQATYTFTEEQLLQIATNRLLGKKP